MSLIMQMVKCPKCGKRYSFNPSVGKMTCPHCADTGIVLKKKKFQLTFKFMEFILLLAVNPTVSGNDKSGESYR